MGTTSREAFTLSEFQKHTTAREQSAVLGREVSRTVTTTYCPRCSEEINEPKHGVEGGHECGIRWVLYGNSLTVWLGTE